MSNELPPETARRLLNVLNAALIARGEAFDEITPEDIAALRACIPDALQDTCTISDDFARAINGPGIYDKYERAGWVKREPSSKVAKMAEDMGSAPEGLLCGDAPEEWGEWVKLAKTGERPDGVLSSEAVQTRSEDGLVRGEVAGHTLAFGGATHYRRKRIRCMAVAETTGERAMVWHTGDAYDNVPDFAPAPGHYCLRGTLWTPATVPEVTAAKAGRDPNGVIAWHGGECPVGEGARGHWHCENGYTGGPGLLAVRNWGRDDTATPFDIIAYEVTG